VENEKLLSLFEAARWSPSSRNEQPWRFVLGLKHRGDSYGRLFESLTEANKSWAHQAPVLVAVVAKLTFERDGSYNRSALLDVGGAIANLTVQAVSVGLQVHQMAGFDRESVRKTCGIPDGFDPVVMLAIGYADEAHLLPFHQRRRFPLSSFVFEGSWGRRAGFLTDGDGHAAFHD
jgi:nitroreductase